MRFRLVARVPNSSSARPHAGKIALGDLVELGVHVRDWPGERPRQRIAEEQGQAHAPHRHPNDHPWEVTYALWLRSTFSTISASALFTSSLVRRSRRSARGVACVRCSSRPRRPSPSDHGDGLTHDLDEPVVLLLDAAQQRGLVLGNVVQPVEVVAKLFELAERRLDHAGVDLLRRQRQGREVTL